MPYNTSHWLLQAIHAEGEQALLEKLEGVSQELRVAQETSSTMQTQLEQAHQEAVTMAELQERVTATEAELKERCEELEALRAQKEQAEKEEEVLLKDEPVESQAEEQVIETVTEAATPSEPQDDVPDEIEMLKNSLKEKESQVTTLEEELKQLRDELELVKTAQTIQEPQQNGVKVEEDQIVQIDSSAANMVEIELLQNSLQEKESTITSLKEQLQTVRAELEAKSTKTPERDVDTDQLQISLKDRESQVAALEDKLKQLRDDIELGKSTQAGSGSETEAEQPFESLEKDSQMLSMEEELQKLKEEMEQVKNKSNDLREKNWAAMEALSAAEKMNVERLAEAKGALSQAEDALTSFQTESIKTLQILFPDIPLETEQSGASLLLRPYDIPPFTGDKILDARSCYHYSDYGYVCVSLTSHTIRCAVRGAGPRARPVKTQRSTRRAPATAPAPPITPVSFTSDAKMDVREGSTMPERGYVI
ncbi:kinectin-like [Osmerus eperlanus]|uniref:kinectin-like n=1 Tax=Osmerus eperlanus TaxID=29151 RepID=UPI002E140FB9